MLLQYVVVRMSRHVKTRKWRRFDPAGRQANRATGASGGRLDREILAYAVLRERIGLSFALRKILTALHVHNIMGVQKKTRKFGELMGNFQRLYAYANTNAATVKRVSKCSPLLSISCGDIASGYWRTIANTIALDQSDSAMLDSRRMSSRTRPKTTRPRRPPMANS